MKASLVGAERSPVTAEAVAPAGGGTGFPRLVEEGELQLALRGDEELGVRLDRGEQAAAVGCGRFLFAGLRRLLGRVVAGIGEGGRGEAERAEEEQGDG